MIANEYKNVSYALIQGCKSEEMDVKQRLSCKDYLQR